SLQDKSIGKRCYKIHGAVSAINYLHFPGKDAPPLRLAGRYIYVQLRPIARRVATLHLDTITADGRPLRVSISTLYGEVTPVGQSVRLPLPFGGPGTHATSWTTVALDTAALADRLAPKAAAAAAAAATAGRAAGGGRGCLQAVKLCSNMVVRGGFCSDGLYSPTTLPQ
ncbi:unnamed protein product, partial [Phaeothamnion confervicola]